MNLTDEEKVDKLREAQEKLFDAIDLIEKVFPDDKNVRTYLIDHLRIYASDEHGFLTSDPNLDELMNRFVQVNDPPRKIRRKR